MWRLTIALWHNNREDGARQGGRLRSDNYLAIFQFNQWRLPSGALASEQPVSRAIHVKQHSYSQTESK